MKTKIYLLPGIMCDNRLWNKLRPLLEKDFDLVHVEIPLKKSLDEMADFLDSYFKEEKINLLGFSLGGYIASYFAVKYPQKVAKLFVMSNSPCDLPDAEIEKRENVIKLVDSYGFSGISKKKIQTLLGDENQENEEIITLIQRMYLDLGENVFTTQLASTLKREDLATSLSRIDIPMTFYYAQEDELVNPTWIEKFKNAKDNITLEVIDSKSHMLPLEKPDAVACQIEQWAKN